MATIVMATIVMATIVMATIVMAKNSRLAWLLTCMRMRTGSIAAVKELLRAT